MLIIQTGASPLPADPVAKSVPAATRLPSVSRSLQILAVLVFVVIVGVTWQQLVQLRTTTLRDTHRQMARLDMVLAEQTGRAVETIDYLLRGAIDQGAATQVSAGSATEQLRREIAGVRQLLAIDIVGPAGDVRRSTRARADRTLPPAALALLARESGDAKAGLLFSEPIRQADGTWTALLARRIDGPDQRFDGIALAWLNLNYFEDFYKAVELAENGAILLHRRDGVVLARYPHEEALVGASFADQPPFRDVLAHAIAGTVEMDSPFDHTRRILAIRALRAFPLAVNVSVDEAPVLAAWRRQAWTCAFAALASGLVVAILLFQLARRSREVERLLVVAQGAKDAAEAAHRDLLSQMEERQRAEGALRQAQRVEAVGLLTGGVAHDFNNLLTVLLGNIDLLQSQPQAAGIAPRLATMRAAAERGASLVGHLLAFARRQPLMPRAVDLGGLIRAMLPLVQSAIGSQITILLDIEDPAPPACVDPTQIELVILNLAINARDAMPLGGQLRLGVGRRTLAAGAEADAPPAGDYVAMTVTDTGTGMAHDVLGRAFEPYFTTKPVGAGSGLGLSQVYGVARQSGGLARIESTLGQGTTVEIVLPLSQAAEAAAEPATRPVVAPGGMPPGAPAGLVSGTLAGPPSGPLVGTPIGTPIGTSGLASVGTGGRARLLVVDDDADVRSTTALLLRRMGYHVIEAATAEAALELLGQDDAIELLLSDVVMPQTSGPELARRARLYRPALPVVFFSGYTDPEMIAGAAPMTQLLRKPFRPAELVGIIEQALASAREAAAV